MAGIGLRLRKILQEETFTAVVRAYFLGAILVLGPFLCSVLCLGGISIFSAEISDLTTRQTFAGAAVYVFGGSLASTGLIQVVLTRYLADEIYRGAYNSLVDSLFPVLLMAAALLLVGALPVLYFIELSFLAKVTLLSLYITVGCLWITVVFASTAHGYTLIVVVFLFGTAIALVSGILLLKSFGLEGLLLGYTAGHFFMLALMIRLLLREFGYPKQWDWGVMRYVKIYPALPAIGILQSLGVWIDKFIFWASDLSLSASGFVTAPKYDSSTFLGFLTAVPAMVHFFVRIEADFSEQFHRYYDEVFFRSSYEDINRAATNLRKAVIKALLDILKVQAMVTFLCAFFGIEILDALGLPVSQIGMFRFGVVASIFLVFMLFSNVVLLYLDCQREVLITAILFFSVNAVFSSVTLGMGYPFYGMGFAAACLVGLLSSLLNLMNQLYNLEFFTFATRPVMGQKRPNNRLRAYPQGGYGFYHDLKPPKKEEPT